MARIRSIKPEFFSHRGLASCSPHARLLAIGMLTLADSEGRFEWIPMQVHAAVFPWEAEVKLQDASLELERVGWVRRYTVDGRDYAEVINFRKHQRLNGKEAQQKSKCPPYKENSQGSDGEAPRCFPEKHLDAQGTGEQGNRGTGEEDQETCAAPTKKPSAPAAPPVICIPTNTGDEFPITQEQSDELAELYPDVDVPAQLRAMRGWCLGNPTKRKTKTGVLRFVNAWLAKEQNEGKGARASPPKPSVADSFEGKTYTGDTRNVSSW